MIITLTASFESGNSDFDYESMGIQAPEGEAEWDQVDFMVHAIACYYSNSNGNTNLITVFGDKWSVKESVEEIRSLLSNPKEAVA